MSTEPAHVNHVPRESSEAALLLESAEELLDRYDGDESDAGKHQLTAAIANAERAVARFEQSDESWPQAHLVAGMARALRFDLTQQAADLDRAIDHLTSSTRGSTLEPAVDQRTGYRDEVLDDPATGQVAIILARLHLRRGQAGAGTSAGRCDVDNAVHYLRQALAMVPLATRRVPTCSRTSFTPIR
jgi:hypothetical protein